MRPVGVLAEHRDQGAVLEARVEHDAVAEHEAFDAGAGSRDNPGTVRSEDPGLRHGREAHAHPHIEVVERRGGKANEYLALAGIRVGDVLVPEDVGAALLVDPDRLHGQNRLMTAAELARRAEELDLDVVGATPAEAYTETEQNIRERRERGLFAGMKFTTACPEVSCHPELLLDGTARTVVSAALCYWSDAPAAGSGEGRLPRYAWRDHYALLRARLDALGQVLGGRYRVLVDENQHVDREGARRAGLGFYGKNTMLITREHGSWVVLGTLVTDASVEATPPLDLDCGRCTLCIDACPTGALDEPGVLDANLCLSYWTQAPAPVPDTFREELGASVYGCDICQDVCPWNRGIEKRRRDRPLPEGAVPNVSLADWLTRDGADLVSEVDRLYVPKNDPRWLRRNALYALGNTGVGGALPLVEPWAESDDPVLVDAAAWATARIAERAR